MFVMNSGGGGNLRKKKTERGEVGHTLFRTVVKPDQIIKGIVTISVGGGGGGGYLGIFSVIFFFGAFRWFKSSTNSIFLY